MIDRRDLLRTLDRMTETKQRRRRIDPRKRFDKVIFAVYHICRTIEEGGDPNPMPIPQDLTRSEVAEAIDSLTKSVETISRLIRRLGRGLASKPRSARDPAADRGARSRRA